ncbi:50S ribosomal protein L25 [Candidatus Berkelbacteria bacterium]|nr:50S ribosomal protein L25 [Candidatus Berkelbacteria bacterium]
MEKVSLTAELRGDKKAKAVLRDHKIPGVLYGHDVKNEHLTVDKKQFTHVFQKAGLSTLVDLEIKDKPATKVLVHDVQYHPLTDLPIHVDFYKVNLTEKIKTEITLSFIGLAPAVDELQGSLIQNKDHVNIEALPQDLVSEIEVDTGVLKTFEDRIHIKDLAIPKGIEVLDDPEEVVALVQPPRSEEELAELEQKVEEKVEDIEIEKKGKEEESEEGAEAAEGEKGARTGESEKTEEKPAPEPAQKKEEK